MKRMAEINITPLVDIVLVLLIIFMVLTPLAQFNQDVAIPPVASAPTVAPAPVLVVSLLTEDRVYINREPVKISELTARLHDVLKNASDKTVFFFADDELGYSLVMSVLDGVRNAGAGRIGIVTSKEVAGIFR